MDNITNEQNVLGMDTPQIPQIPEIAELAQTAENFQMPADNEIRPIPAQPGFGPEHQLEPVPQQPQAYHQYSQGQPYGPQQGQAPQQVPQQGYVPQPGQMPPAMPQQGYPQFQQPYPPQFSHPQQGYPQPPYPQQVPPQPQADFPPMNVERIVDNDGEHDAATYQEAQRRPQPASQRNKNKNRRNHVSQKNKRTSWFRDDADYSADSVDIDGETFWFRELSQQVQTVVNNWPALVMSTFDISPEELNDKKYMSMRSDIAPQMSVMLEQMWDKVLLDALVDWSLGERECTAKNKLLLPKRAKRIIFERIVATSNFGAGEEEFFRGRDQESGQG